MKIYLDVSCLNRPFDDQSQMRIRLESEAVTLILEQCEHEEWENVSSEMAAIEIEAISDENRKARVELLLPDVRKLLKLTEAVFARGGDLEGLGFKPADAVHIAAAESLEADVLLTCDDRLIRLARRRRGQLRVRVENPLDWLKEMGHGIDS